MSSGKAGVYIKELNFSGGAKLKLIDNSIVVLVGPNNSGKSLSLREINHVLRDGDGDTKSVSSITIERIGDDEALANAVAPFRSPKDGYYYLGDSEYSHTSSRDVATAWKSDGPKISDLAKLFVAHLTTATRLEDSNPVPTFDASKLRTGIHPIHSLYLDLDKEHEVSNLFRSFFGLDLVIHRSPGREIPLYVGVRPPLEGNETLNSRSYLDKVEDLQPLHLQGDGFRSFASIVLRVWTGVHSVILVDEPEAFLHPPQARAIGEIISAGTEYQKQIFIATHSNEVIQGLLSKFPDRVYVVRLDKSPEGRSAVYLPSEQVSELWKDPILRYSNILSGLFHDKVIVTEADGDCRFYEAIADAQGSPYGSIFFTYAGGKDRIAVIVRALRALHVPVRVVVDIDAFADDAALKGIINAFGEDWDAFRSDISSVRNVIQSRKSLLIGLGFKERVRSIVANVKDTEIVPKDIISKLSSSMKETSPWESIKEGGVAAIPSGEPTRQINQLIARLRDIGIFVVPVGQMERFYKEVGNHGPRWVMEVLKKDLQQDPDLEGARTFVSNLVTFETTPPVFKKVDPVAVKRLMLSRKDETKKNFKTFVRNLGNTWRTIFYITMGSYFGIQTVMLIYHGIIMKK
ncbi:AAA family ATPase [Methylobacterium sp. C1]|uniref:ATP-dependent nuclease n=1 Tax=Methylobacterium sp. C1 TaxID=1479019 RepID=UPI0009F17065|nr:AAA family ATPase [Methylobacterium sp. C1]